jgi:hypothetical protein
LNGLFWRRRMLLIMSWKGNSGSGFLRTGRFCSWHWIANCSGTRSIRERGPVSCPEMSCPVVGPRVGPEVGTGACCSGEDLARPKNLPFTTLMPAILNIRVAITQYDTMPYSTEYDTHSSTPPEIHAFKNYHLLNNE